MQKSGCSLFKCENPLYKNIISEKNLLLLAPKLYTLGYPYAANIGCSDAICDLLVCIV